MDRQEYHQQYYQNNKEAYKAYRETNHAAIMEQQKLYKRTRAPIRKAKTFMERFNRFDEDTKALIIEAMKTVVENT